MGSESRSRYLVFALRIRKLTDSLIALVEEGRYPPDLNNGLNAVMASIEGSGERTNVRSLRDRGSFGNYENAVTISEVMKARDKAELLQKLRLVMNSRTSAERREGALQAIEFFDALEGRALYHYNHPAPRLAVHK
jgi:hypothetical protein